MLVDTAMHRNLTFGSEHKACAIAANSLEYGFCSDLTPSVEEKVSMSELPCTDSASWIAPLTPTLPFLAELLTAMRTAHPCSVSARVIVSSVIVCAHFSHGAKVNGLIVSKSSIAISLTASATW